MDDVIFARALHVLGVVIWIGGVAMATMVVLPAVRRGDLGDNRLKAFQAIEHRFVFVPGDVGELRAALRRGKERGDLVGAQRLRTFGGTRHGASVAARALWPRARRQAICRWAKSWQTPRRRAMTSDTGVSTVVTPGW